MNRCMGDQTVQDDFGKGSDQAVAVCRQKWDDRHKKGQGMSLHYLRESFVGRPDAVDRKANVLRGYVVAQLGVFKDRRGEFNGEGLRQIVRVMNSSPKGLKSRLGHPSLSDDGVGKFLGRARDARLGKAVDAATGKAVEAVRADLHFDPTAADTPHGNLSDYVLRLAESDPDAFSSSLVIEPEEVEQLDAKGRQLLDAEGNPLPPLWLPKRLHASDIVDTGDAVDGLLSAPQLAEALSVGLTPELRQLFRFDRVARLAAQLLDGMFPAAGRDEVGVRCRAWLDRYLAGRFGPPGPEPERPRLAERLGRLAELAAAVRGRMLFAHNSTVADGEPDWGGVDKTALPRAAFADPGDAGQKSTWGFPHHWVKGGGAKDDNGVYTSGTMYLHAGGLNAAWSAAQGGRSGQKASPAVIAHLAAHRRALGLDQGD